MQGLKIKNRAQLNKTLPLAFLLVGGVLMLLHYSFGQEPVKTIPDGTEGEVLLLIDTTPAKNKKKSWNTFNLGFTSLKIGFGFLVDYATYAQDSEGNRQMDSAKVELKPGFKVRDSRLSIGGKFNTKRSITWKAGLMYDGAQDAWLVRESGIMVAVPELWGHFFVGRTKEGVSMSKVMNGYSGEIIERHMALDPIPILADGVKWLGFLPKPRPVRGGKFWRITPQVNWYLSGNVRLELVYGYGVLDRFNMKGAT